MFKRVKSHLVSLTRRCDRVCLLVVFHSWVKQCLSNAWSASVPTFLTTLQTIRFERALCWKFLEVVSCLSRQTLHHSKSVFYNGLSQRLGPHVVGASYEDLWNTLQQLGAIGKKPRRRQAGFQQAMQLPDGSLVTAPDELALAWQAHFASIEAGDLISPALLRALCLTRQSIQRPPLFDVQPEDLPTLHEVERAVRSLNKKKATGPDQIPAAFLSEYVVESNIFYILLFSKLSSLEGSLFLPKEALR